MAFTLQRADTTRRHFRAMHWSLFYLIGFYWRRRSPFLSQCFSRVSAGVFACVLAVAPRAGMMCARVAHDVLNADVGEIKRELTPDYPVMLEKRKT
jgi:hypothetical protein